MAPVMTRTGQERGGQKSETGAVCGGERGPSPGLVLSAPRVMLKISLLTEAQFFWGLPSFVSKVLLVKNLGFIHFFFLK